uniref:Uncharacterized protein n=1 Tax=Anguilla anguilla TaxID=7936 RepID=A0A0E9Q5K1_ANGAN
MTSTKKRKQFKGGCQRRRKIFGPRKSD